MGFRDQTQVHMLYWQEHCLLIYIPSPDQLFFILVPPELVILYKLSPYLSHYERNNLKI